MEKKLFLLDGMALVYRAHFALIARPIYSSKGVNTSALYGFTQTLLEILRNQQPTHIAVAFDTDVPTQRHTDFADYKATRQAMPEDLVQALPHVRHMLEAFRIPVLTCDGYEADDIIGTLVWQAEKEGFKSFMVTPDKDFAQLVDENTFLYKPSRMGDGRGEGERGEDLVLTSETERPLAPPKDLQAHLKKLADTPHQYHVLTSPSLRHDLITSLLSQNSFCFHTAATSSDPKEARLL